MFQECPSIFQSNRAKMWVNGALGFSEQKWHKVFEFIRLNGPGSEVLLQDKLLIRIA